MKWSEISIHTTQEAIEAVANILHESGASGVVIEDPQDLTRKWEDQYGEIYELNPADYPEEGVIVKAYLPVNSFLGETVEEIKQALNNLALYDIDLGHGTVRLSEVHEEEWATAWKKYYKPMRISDRIVITPTWEEYVQESEHEVVIELDPGMAFGTGTHPTTVLCIQALEDYVKPGFSLFDVGCGTGVLGIAAAKLGAGKVLALDLDEMAVEIARINVKLNGVSEQVQVKRNNLLDGIVEKADLIVANILAEVILRFTAEAYDHLKKDGYFIASGIIQTKEPMVRQALQEAGFHVVEARKMEDWYAIIARKAV
ncbi:ribosomal protein L11 methyltransferase [[Clostridium] ultunense Esp]|uniref:50S ribosomal protein L11 methyltransferase n=1 Tax=Thermicanus aegyptius TaxID=94009 RepID=UPI0002B6F140|nr:50S ribosomal protein L11 methyltransferase [Thermicanus aegyptius]CCQ94322.1 ribosomal protein L11 methyltransferase [[Clostridium] ultunense Esp]